MSITVVQGDLFKADADVILHQVNCKGFMRSGVALQVRNKYPEVYKQYLKYCDHYDNPADMLGHIQVICVGNDPVKYVVNMFAQENFGYDGKCYTDYDALRKCLEQVNVRFKGKRIAIPYLMACHRGGGDWTIVSKMIEDTLVDCDVTFYRYVPA